MVANTEHDLQRLLHHVRMTVRQYDMHISIHNRYDAVKGDGSSREQTYRVDNDLNCQVHLTTRNKIFNIERE